ncbi:MAG: hypothetical protein RR212_13595, partial [Bacteroidales bacterium]
LFDEISLEAAKRAVIHRRWSICRKTNVIAHKKHLVVTASHIFELVSNTGENRPKATIFFIFIG